MKRVILGITLVGATTLGMAQRYPHAGGNRGYAQKECCINDTNKDLNLTTEQKEKIRVAREKQRDGNQKQRTENHKKMDKEMKKILTPEQYKKWQNNNEYRGRRVVEGKTKK